MNNQEISDIVNKYKSKEEVADAVFHEMIQTTYKQEEKIDELEEENERLRGLLTAKNTAWKDNFLDDKMTEVRIHLIATTKDRGYKKSDDLIINLKSFPNARIEIITEKYSKEFCDGAIPMKKCRAIYQTTAGVVASPIHCPNLI